MRLWVEVFCLLFFYLEAAEERFLMAKKASIIIVLSAWPGFRERGITCGQARGYLYIMVGRRRLQMTANWWLGWKSRGRRVCFSPIATLIHNRDGSFFLSDPGINHCSFSSIFINYQICIIIFQAWYWNDLHYVRKKWVHLTSMQMYQNKSQNNSCPVRIQFIYE